MKPGKQQISTGHLGRLVAAALFAMATLTTSTTTVVAADNGRDWRVSDIRGDAQRQANGAWRALKRGDMVHPGDKVRTGTAGRAILVRPGDSLDMAPNSEFSVPRKADAAKGRPATHIMQSRGTILFKITTRPENPFTVKTPYLAAVIKGTVFTVSVDGDDAALHVSKGAVQVTSVLNDQTVLVRPGQTAAVNALRGGALRLIGFNRSNGGRGAPGGTKAALDDISEGKAGRGNITAVIPKTVGVTTVNIGKVSKGLVSAPGRPTQVHRNGGKDVGENGIKGGGDRKSAKVGVSRIFSNPVSTSYSGVSSNGVANGIVNGHGSLGGPGNGVGNGLGNGVGGGLGNGVGSGGVGSVGNGPGSSGIGNGVGNSVSNAIGNSVGNGGGNGKGKGKGKGGN